MMGRLEEISEDYLKNLIVETRACFSQLVYRLDRFKDNMEGGFDDLTCALEELNYRI